MVRSLFLVIAAAQQPAPPALPQPIAKVVIEPAQPTVQAGDTLRLRAAAYDSAGRRLDQAAIGWFTAGRGFEGSVDSTGLVHAGSTGSLRIAAVARIPGSMARSTVAFAAVDIVAPPAARLAVTPRPERLLAGTSVPLEAVPYAATGDRRYDPVTWRSSDARIARVDAGGRLAGVAPGRATITAGAASASERWTVTVVPNTVARVTVTPGDTAVHTGDVVRFVVRATDARGRAVAEARPEWSLLSTSGRASIDPDGGFVADEPGTYRVLGLLGSRRAEGVVQVAPRNTTRQAQIVGRLPLKGTLTAEVWLHPDGKHAYLSTISDRVYAIDVSNPAAPVITDSVLVDARVINDVMTTEDGRYGVVTREAASTRRNGIVILSFEDPAHPKPIAEFTETVTGGVHSAFVYRGYVFLTDDATGSLRVIDIRDPYRPRQVARWQTPTEGGRMLHDVDVRDGLAYLSYWNDGLVILDVGAGIKGGSPENPQLVSQLKYDLNALYKRVELVGGP
ncbi:MAG: Ig-like domain-containing protein, partial [Gemmatimonadales bacterium]